MFGEFILYLKRTFRYLHFSRIIDSYLSPSHFVMSRIYCYW